MTSRSNASKSAAQIRALFLDFFKRHSHTVVGSSSLIPANDPTLLFTNAGMVQFKDNLLDPSTSPYKRATTVQKCLRVGGKHNDLENVGYTARHHTFFEMLGNFSFGDYFKKEAIAFAWNLLTVELGLDKNRLYVSVFRDDDEAEKIWAQEIGVAANRIVRKDEKDNFWSMGDTGPCGPCTEIIYDQGPQVGCGRPTCDVFCDCDRHLEIWNLVFMQYDRSTDGKLNPLPKPCIDTGMGLERIVSIVQGVTSNYHTDSFQTIIHAASKITGVEYQFGKAKTDPSLHVVADHLRAAAFMIGEGILPSNEGRGYVLRRILRRAMRHGRNLGAKKPFLFEAVRTVIEDMLPAYPELGKQRTNIENTIREEEQQFIEVLDRGMKHLADEVQRLRSQKSSQFPGNTAFHLYETYGFPVDLTEDVLKGEGLTLDRSGFDAAQEQHRQKAKGSWGGNKTDGNQAGEIPGHLLWEALKPKFETLIRGKGWKTEFIGYQNLEGSGELLAIFDRNGESVKQLTAGQEGFIVLSRSPFYAESGGQIGDQGVARSASAHSEVSDTQKITGVWIHRIRLAHGDFKVGETLQLVVDRQRRQLIARNHTLTHILHFGLRETLGGHIRQAGSYLDASRLTFDFSHGSALSPLQLKAIEMGVNQRIWANAAVNIREMKYTDAIAEGATAFFEEKYGDVVRVVSVGDFSKELCGGTHLTTTSEIGLCHLRYERSVGSKTRRIEAVSGLHALNDLQEQRSQLGVLSETLGVSVQNLGERVQALIEENRGLKKKLKDGESQQLGSSVDQLVAQVKTAGEVRFVSGIIENATPQNLREFADKALDRIKTGMVAVGCIADGKAAVVVKVSKDLTARLSADKVLKAICGQINGKGGGRPDMAQGGGDNTTALAPTLANLERFLG